MATEKYNQNAANFSALSNHFARLDAHRFNGIEVITKDAEVGIAIYMCLCKLTGNPVIVIFHAEDMEYVIMEHKLSRKFK